MGVIAADPTALMHPPRITQTEIEIIREDEIKIVLDGVRSSNLLLYTIATVALASGMRRCELLALRWKEVDRDGGKSHFEQSF